LARIVLPVLPAVPRAPRDRAMIRAVVCALIRTESEL
jgi:hypothetical protein